MDIFAEQEKAYNYIENTIVKNKKISHAYLIETNGYDKASSFVKEMIKKILFIDKNEDEQRQIGIQIDSGSYIDMKVIEPDGYWIKKEQLVSLEQEFSKKSILGNKLIYVITDAEKLNDSSANTILKFLEEPVDDIIAILVADNRYKVIDTILSRCQVISLLSTKNVDNYNDGIIDLATNIFNQKYLMVNFNNYYEQFFIDKNTAIDTISTLEDLFFKYINGQIKNINGKEYSKERIIKVLIVLNSEKEKLTYNVNLKLWLHELIINVTEVK